MRKLLFALCAGLASLSAQTQAATYREAAPERPKLVVGIVVDQMRWDYLYRYYDRYGENGFKRLLDSGFSCENTMLNYIPTVTAAGHTCIYTGSVPSIHGIAGNDFMIERTGKHLYCTDDSLARSVGTDSKAGQMSPRNMLVSTVTDELRLATNFRSKTIGIALKDRGAILPAGHTANAAYWFDDRTGAFITSTYYMDELPPWVRAFNEQDRAAQLLKQDWTPLLPAADYTQSTADDTRYETPFVKGTAPTLPVKTSELYKKEGYKVIRNTPYGNTLTLEMAEAALKNEQLGKGAYTDFLAVSLSSTDYVGHQFGINAIETEDTYLRLDKDLADFLACLDREVGQGNYLLFLTADHAAAHNVRFMADNRLPAGAWPYDKTRASMDSLVNVNYGLTGVIRGMDNYQVHLDRNKIENAGVDYGQVKETLIRFLETQQGIAYAIDMEKAAVAPIPAPIRERIVNGYNRERSGAIQVIMQPGWYDVASSAIPTGTTHGVWHPYDSHIPLLFYGWKINRGSTNREVYMTDIAPTVAALLRIQMPNGCIGKPITEVAR